jgi:DNA sulfur modification protein DndE
MYYGDGDPEDLAVAGVPAHPVTDRTPEFRDITIRNVTCTGARRAVLMNGLPELPLSGIVFDSLTITSRAGFQSTFARDLVLRDASFFVERGPVLSFRQSAEVTVTGLSYRPGGDLLLEVLGERSRAIRLVRVDRTGAEQRLQLGEGVALDAVEWQK